MRHTNIAVIGGGLSGITFAHFAAKSGKSVIILEKQPFPGGAIHTSAPYSGSDFFVELGAHTIYSSYGTLLEMIEDTGIKGNIIPHLKPGYLMYEKGGIVSLFSCVSFAGLAATLFRFPFYKKTGLTVKDYYTKVFGVKNYENLIHPMTSAVICQDSANVAADLLLKSRKKDKSYPRAFSLSGGLQPFLEKVASGNGISLHTSVSVSSIEQNDGKYIIRTGGGEYLSDSIALAADAFASAGLIDCWRDAPDRIKKLAERLKELPVKKSVAFGLSAPADSFKIQPFGYIIAKDSPFRAVVSRDVIKDELYRGATFHFKPESDPSVYSGTVHDILKINREQPINTETIEFTLPELRVTHAEWRREVESLSDVKNFYLLGNFFGGLSLEDCAIRAKHEAKRAAGE
ncbi:MAG: FAD-dependent oxidoreductase [Deferribacteraceae bacterium]|nr:FAD-dependent oxidoreductase [Deferribacteraceae bacterium]